MKVSCQWGTHNITQLDKDFIFFIHVTFTECDGKVTPAFILAFITGTTTVPPMGFDHGITIRFTSDKSKTLPVASTCSLVLWFPTALVDYTMFKERMDFALLNTVGFGCV